MPTGANYTDDMPSVAKVESAIQGSDPIDTAARQVTVFDYLVTYIDRVHTNTNVRAPYTPGEAKLTGDYRGASAQITQGFTKSHTAAEVQTFNQLQGKYLFDDTFMSTWPKQLIGSQASAAIQNANAGLQASAQKMYNQQMQAQQQAASQQTAMVNGQAMPMSNDPTSVAIRRCLELGGSTGSCMGGGLIGGMISLVTGGEGLGSLTGPGRAGVVLSGAYGGAKGGTYVNFSGDSGALSNCGKLVPDSTNYTLSKTAAALQVTLPVSPSPVLLTMKPDGSLQGPGAITLNGQIIIGYHVVTTTRTGNCAPNCVTSSRTPIYQAATDRCTVAALTAPPPPPPPSANANGLGDSPLGGGLLGGVMDTLTGAMTATMPGASLVASLPGLRMEGKYTSSGLLLDFAGDAVTIDCGQAHVKSPYTVENAASSLIVHVRNSGGPFDLVVSSDNTLRGSGSTTINGKLVSGMNGTDITFTPHFETCQVASYAPQAGSGSTTTVAANASPAPGSSSGAFTATATPATSNSQLGSGASCNDSLDHFILFHRTESARRTRRQIDDRPVRQRIAQGRRACSRWHHTGPGPAGLRQRLPAAYGLPCTRSADEAVLRRHRDLRQKRQYDPERTGPAGQLLHPLRRPGPQRRPRLGHAGDPQGRPKQHHHSNRDQRRAGPESVADSVGILRHTSKWNGAKAMARAFSARGGDWHASCTCFRLCVEPASPRLLAQPNRRPHAGGRERTPGQGLRRSSAD